MLAYISFHLRLHAAHLAQSYFLQLRSAELLSAYFFFGPYADWTSAEQPI